MVELFTREPYLSFIEDGRKTLDIRIGTQKVKRSKTGDVYMFRNRAKRIVRKVTAIRTYESFEAMLKVEPYLSIAPNAASSEDVLKGLRVLYPPDLEKLGVYVFELAR